MKIKLLSALAFCAMLASCGQSTSNSQPGNSDSAAAETPSAQTEQNIGKKSEPINWAANFLKAVDRKKYCPDELTDNEFEEAYKQSEEFFKQINEYNQTLSVTHDNGDCSETCNVYTFEKKDGKGRYVLLINEAGCNGSAVTEVYAFNFDGKTATEVENPLTRPSLEELTKDIDESELSYLKSDYAADKGMKGLDIRIEDNGDLAIRPGYLDYDELWDRYTPALYKFNGETFVKK